MGSPEHSTLQQVVLILDLLILILYHEILAVLNTQAVDRLSMINHVVVLDHRILEDWDLRHILL